MLRKPKFNLSMAKRFRGFLPVVVDVETAGFNADSDALLEIAAVFLNLNAQNKFQPDEILHYHVKPFPGANLEKKSLEFTGIDPHHPFRYAITEEEALEKLYAAINKTTKRYGCTRAVLVGHNPFFDLGFIKAASERCGFKKMPFHSFTTFDTATLGGLAFGQTVLSRAVQAAGHSWNNNEAHSAIYDAERTAQLFCTIVNWWTPEQE